MLYLTIYNGIISAFMISNLFGNEREIAAGGVTNKLWLTSMQYLLCLFCMVPLSVAWPLFDFYALSWGFSLTIVALGGLAYVAHMNLISLNEGSPEKLIKLPFSLHLNSTFQNAILSLQSSISYLIISIYAVAIVAIGLQVGGMAYVAASLSMIAIDQAKQQGVMPEFINKPYFYVSIYLGLSSVFGLTSYFAIGVTSLFLGYSVWDLLSTRVFKTSTDNILFPMSKPITSLSLDKMDKKKFNIENLKKLATKIYPKKLKVTFDHFSKSYDVIAKLTKDVPSIAFDNYSTLLNKVDFDSEGIKNLLMAQFVVQDEFMAISYAGHRQALGLGETTSEHQVRVAYLTNQMQLTVSRLNTAICKDLPQERVLQLQKQARYILQFIDNNFEKNNETCSLLLINIALKAGQHCNRMYIDTFADLFSEATPDQTNVELSLAESFALAMQEFREKTFKNYYFKTVKKLKEENPLFNAIYSDVTDYHSYESFVGTFGQSLYLKNPLLGQELIKTPIDIIFAYYLKLIFGIDQMSFDYDYCVDAMVKEILSPAQAPLLHKLFERWLEEIQPGAYNEFVLDEDCMLDSSSDVVIGLVKLMLLDLSVADFEKPMDIKSEADNFTITESDETQTAGWFDFFRSKPVLDELDHQAPILN